MRIPTAVLLLFLISACSIPWTAPISAQVVLTPPSSSIEDALTRQTKEQQEKSDRAVKLAKPLFDCVRRKAHSQEIYTSAESTDVAARAAVGLCSKEEGAYRSAVYQLAMVATSFDASAQAKQTHEKLVDVALTIIVGERQPAFASQNRRAAWK